MNTSARSLRLGFAGTPQFAVPALDRLHASAHRIAAVFTQPDRPAGRGRAVQSSAVKTRALQLGLPVLQPSTFKSAQALAQLRALDLDALVVVAYGQILPQDVLDTPREGCFNIHASLLPRWRGAAPIQRAILEGDRSSGVTIMRMAAGLDTGPMLLVREIPIAAAENAASLHDRLAALGAACIVEALDAVAAGTCRAVEQPADGVTYAHKIAKAEARIDWREDAAAVLRRVRAFNPWPVAETQWQGTQLRIWEAALTPAEALPSMAPRPRPAGTVLSGSAEGIDVACGAGILRVLRLQLAGRKPLEAAEFLKSQPLDGACFAAA